MLELHHLPESICSQKVRLALAEKGLDWTGHRVNLAAWEHLSPAYLALNPNGVIPTLVHDGRPVIESTVICEYLDEVFPDPPLSPETAAGRAAMRAWLRFIDETPSMAVRVPSFNDVLLPKYRQRPAAEFEAALERMTVRKGFFRRMGRDGFPPEEYADAMEQLRLSVERIAAALERLGGPWLMGAQLTCADLCLGPVVQRMADLRLLEAEDAATRAARGWLEALRTRPSWHAAFPAEAYFPRPG